MFMCDIPLQYMNSNEEIKTHNHSYFHIILLLYVVAFHHEI